MPENEPAGPGLELPEERLRDALAADAGDTASGDVAAIQRALDGEAGPSEVRALIDRLGEEPALAETWRAAVVLRRELGGTQRSHRRSRVVRWGVAAALAAAGLTMLFVGLPAPAPVPERSVYRGIEENIHSLVKPGAELPRDDFELRWSSGLEDPIYAVEVLDGELRLLHRATGIETDHLRVPAAALADLAPGADVLWRVEAVEADGTRHDSPTFSQKVR